jgi:hypothetical protein
MGGTVAILLLNAMITRAAGEYHIGVSDPDHESVCGRGSRGGCITQHFQGTVNQARNKYPAIPDSFLEFTNIFKEQ